MIYTVFQYALCVACIPVLAALVCRLDAMEYRTTWWPVIVMHVAMGVSVASAARYAWEQTAALGSMGALVAGMAWLYISFKTWGTGSVPPYLRTEPEPLNEADMRKVHGGTK